MRHLIILILSNFLLSACYTTPDIEPRPEISGNYKLDPTHASVIWRVNHVGLSFYTARFDDITGTLRFDSVNPENSAVDIRIDPQSVSTGLPDFDETIATGENYFNAEVYPEIRFVSSSIAVSNATAGVISGELTFRGVTRPLDLDVTFNGAGSSFGNPGETLGFSATGKLDRTEYGLTHLSNFGIGTEVELQIEVEFNEDRDS